MFGSIGLGEILVLVVVGLIVLGPERLPGAITWTFSMIRKVREHVTDAADQIKEEFGPEIEKFQEPLNELQKLRNLNPKQMITNQLFGETDPQDYFKSKPKPKSDPEPKKTNSETANSEKELFDPDAT